MADCDDRQLTQAQREAAYSQQARAGVVRAIRPFSGNPTIPNIIDYLNRELVPAVKTQRAKLNDIYRPVVDNAPSGNPLSYYFSENTANGDPTTGFIRFDNATQELATTIRVSETNGRLANAAPWLDVMAGGATTPLGTVTVSDLGDPTRFIRFDLNTMTDQGAYWDLGVTPIESSHDNPFVDGGPVTIGFIPGVASTPVTVPVGSVTPMGAHTVLGNPTNATAAPTEIGMPVGMSVLARKTTTGDIIELRADEFVPAFFPTPANLVLCASTGGTSLLFKRINTTSIVDVPSGHILINATNALGPLINRSLTTVAGLGLSAILDPNYNLNVNPSTSVVIDFPGTNEVQRAALTGDVTAAQNSNTTAFRSFTALSVLGRSAGTAGIPTEIAAVVSSEAVLHEALGSIAWGQVTTGGYADGSITDPKITNRTALSVWGRSANSSGPIADIAASAGSAAVLRESGSTIGWGTIATAGLADDSVTNAKLAEMAANTVKANATASTANPTDFAVGTNTVLGRVAGNIVAAQLVNAQITDATIANAKLANMAAGTVKGRALTAGTGAPSDLTGAEVGQIVRYGTDVEDTSAGTVATFTIASTTTSIRCTPATALTIQGIAYTGPADPEAGKEIVLYNSRTSTQNVTLAHNSSSTGAAQYRFFLPANIDMVLRPGDAVRLRYAFSRWIGGQRGSVSDADYGDITVSAGGATWTIDNDVVSNAKLANMTAGTVKGRQIDASTGDPVDLTGAEVAELLRIGTVQTESGATPLAITLNADTTFLSIATTGDADIRTITGSTLGRVVLLMIFASSGIKTLKHNFSAGTSSALINPGLIDLTTRVRDTFLLVGLGTDGWQVVRTRVGTDMLVDAAVTDAKLRNSGALSVIGRSANSSGAPADISATAASGAVLRESGSALGFGTIATAGVADDAITNAKLANMAAATVKGRAIGAGTGDPTDLTQTQLSDLFRVVTSTTDTPAPGSFNDYAVAEGIKLLRINPSSSGDVELTGLLLGSNNGGGWIRLFHQGTSGTERIVLKHANAGSSANNQFILPEGVDYILDRFGDAVDLQYIGGRWQVISQQINTQRITSDAVTDAKLRNSGACSVIGRSANSSGDPADISASTNDRVFVRRSNALVFDQIVTGDIADGVITVAKLAGIGANTVIGNDTGSTTTPNAISVGANTVLGRQGSNLVAAQVATGQVANNAVTNAKLAQMAQSTIKGRAEGAGTGDPGDLTPSQVASIIDGESITWTAAHIFNGVVSMNDTVDLSGAVRFTEVLSTGTIGLNDLDLSGASVLRLTGSAWILSGMVPAVSGRFVLIVNAHSTDTGSILLESTSSGTAANRFAGVGTSRAIKPGEMALSWYDGVDSRWRLLCRDDVDL